MRAIYLTGFMGSGKTTIGKLLSKASGLPVFDTDVLVEEKEGKSIKDIFLQEGEAYFRERESEILRALSGENMIVTTGGGIILAKENREWIRKNGYWVYLHCDPEEIEHRLVNDTSRPLLAGEKSANLRSIFEKRLPLYREAPIQVDTTNKSTQEVVEEILNALQIESASKIL
ncbi:shikimate kinase [Peribacillus tepidiphilus]|uniref:shikimate kinase n=1 Tax=Peribacillus tepidiphilus TaxID=2652445 RepID=UPI0035B53AA9